VHQFAEGEVDQQGADQEDMDEENRADLPGGNGRSKGGQAVGSCLIATTSALKTYASGCR
jgi:hypothetical protein